MTIYKILQLRESEDHIEFKEAKHNYPFTGGKHTDPRDRRHCSRGHFERLLSQVNADSVFDGFEIIPR